MLYMNIKYLYMFEVHLVLCSTCHVLNVIYYCRFITGYPEFYVADVTVVLVSSVLLLCLSM